MDPYTIFEYKVKTYSTPVKNEAGKKPKWNYKFEIYIKDINDRIKF
mgnify:CR=1 FL=1